MLVVLGLGLGSPALRIGVQSPNIVLFCRIVDRPRKILQQFFAFVDD